MPSFLVSHKGAISGVADEFTHTLVVTGAGTPQSVAETCRDAWMSNGWNRIDGIRGNTSPTVSYTEVAAAEILSLLDGDLSAAYHAEYAAGASVTGTGSGTSPAQTACCVSLTAGFRPNGVPLKGRFYLPVPDQVSYGASGLFTETYRTEIAESVAEYVSTLATEGLDAGVWSRSLATFSTLTQVRVGNRPDTIRTRRNSEPEEYTVIDL